MGKSARDMVTIDISDTTAVCFVPIPTEDVVGALFPNGTQPASGFTLTLRCTSGLEAVTPTITESNVVGFLASLEILTAGLHAGEWEYALAYVDSAGAEHTATGLFIIEGEFVRTREYNTKIEYKQYGE